MTSATLTRGRKVTTRGMAVEHLIATRSPFSTHGALHAQFMRVGTGVGNLPAKYRVQLFEDWKASGLELYVVFSYATPIAWFVPGLAENGGWRIPDVKYSPTTSRHQGKLNRIAPVAVKAGYRV